MIHKSLLLFSIHKPWTWICLWMFDHHSRDHLCKAVNAQEPPVWMWHNPAPADLICLPGDCHQLDDHRVLLSFISLSIIRDGTGKFLVFLSPLHNSPDHYWVRAVMSRFIFPQLILSYHLILSYLIFPQPPSFTISTLVRLCRRDI